MSKFLACLFYPSILLFIGYLYSRLEMKVLGMGTGYDPQEMARWEEKMGYGAPSSGDSFVNAAMFLSQED